MIEEASPLWLMEQDPGPAGNLLRRLPAGWQVALRELGARASLEANPWSALIAQESTPAWRNFFRAGESQWNALRHLARIRTGASTLRTDWPTAHPDSERALRRTVEHWLKTDIGTAHWQRLQTDPSAKGFHEDLGNAAQHYRTREAKRGRQTHPLRMWDEVVPRAVLQIATRWMALCVGTAPGFCWWSDRATAQFFELASPNNRLDEGWFRKTTTRLGLRKARRVLVSSVRKQGRNAVLLDYSGKTVAVLQRTG